MTDFKRMYYLLFNKITDALNAIDNLNFGQAADVLRSAQVEAEELYVSGEDDHD